jgi:hypothetical protein
LIILLKIYPRKKLNTFENNLNVSTKGCTFLDAIGMSINEIRMSNDQKSDGNECRYGNSDRWNGSLVENLPNTIRKEPLNLEETENGLSHSWELITTHFHMPQNEFSEKLVSEMMNEMIGCDTSSIYTVSRGK